MYQLYAVMFILKCFLDIGADVLDLSGSTVEIDSIKQEPVSLLYKTFVKMVKTARENVTF